MRTVKEYYLICHEISMDMEREINEKLKKGWHLYGNIFSKEGNQVHMYQAMVKYEDEKC